MSVSTEEVRRRAERFVHTVTDRIGKSPGDRAALRRAVGRTPHHPTARPAHAIVAPYVRPDTDDTATERAFYAVAAMIAAQPRKARERAAADEPTEPEPTTSDPAGLQQGTAGEEGTPEEPPAKSLGVTLGEAAAAGKLKPETTEARLHLLCRQGVDGIHRQLPRLITQLRSDLVPVDWPTLLVDLSRWQRSHDWVTKQWLQDYYRTYHRNTAAARKASTPESEDE